MNLYRMLALREANHEPLRIGLIGAGKFGSMFLSQVLKTPGMHLLAVADLNPLQARESLKRVGFKAAQLAAKSFDAALRRRQCFITDDAISMIESSSIDIVIDATGSPAAGIAHVLACCEHGKHIVMVNVEADALAGPLLARRAAEAGIVYSLAYGDQPALICEMIDWAQTCGFEVIAAGKGTKYLPAYHQSTPATVWSHYGLSEAQAQLGGMNSQMFNSFLDGTKSAIEMAAVSNASGLLPAPEGLSFPPCGVDDLARVLRPRELGGVLAHRGQVEVISSLERDGRPVFRDLRWGVYVTLAGDSDYVRRCFKEYGLVTDPSGAFTAMYKPFHLIGLELGITVASVGLRAEPTGAPRAWHADVIATAKRDLKVDERLDGEGGFTVYGRLMPAADSLRLGGLPLGLAQGIKLKRAVKCGEALRWSDVRVDAGDSTVRFRKAMELSMGEELASA
ncbi:MAG: flagellar biosynthesis protein FlgA [Betaproteobacteria bacterium]|nr:flagellar biosynthesis protein FlgA [Betaproteobacteria bacterium]